MTDAQLTADRTWFEEHSDQREYKRPLRDDDGFIVFDDFDHVHVYYIRDGVRARTCHDVNCEIVGTGLFLPEGDTLE